MGSLLLWQIWQTYRSIELYPVQSWHALEGADCAIVLTGGRGRLRQGLQLLRRGQIRHLIISGVHVGTQIVDLISWQDELMNWGLNNLHLEHYSRTTYGNAQQSWPLAEALDCSSVYLMTSQVHMPRALKTFSANKPRSIALIPRSTPAPFMERDFSAKIWESIKDVFYSYWAY